VWLLRQQLGHRQTVAVRTGLAITGICAAAAIFVGAVFVFGEIIFWLTDF